MLMYLHFIAIYKFLFKQSPSLGKCPKGYTYIKGISKAILNPLTGITTNECAENCDGLVECNAFAHCATDCGNVVNKTDNVTADIPVCYLFNGNMPSSSSIRNHPFCSKGNWIFYKLFFVISF